MVVLIAKRVDIDDIMKDLKIERDEAIAYYEHTIRARNSLTYQLINRTSVPIIEASRKTTKIPDAPIFSNGK